MSRELRRLGQRLLVPGEEFPSEGPGRCYEDWRQRAIRHGIEMSGGFGVAGLAWISASNTFINGVVGGVPTHPSPITWEFGVCAFGILLGAGFLLSSSWERMPWIGKKRALRDDRRALEGTISHALAISSINVSLFQSVPPVVEYELHFTNGRDEVVEYDIDELSIVFDGADDLENQIPGVDNVGRLLPSKEASYVFRGVKMWSGFVLKPGSEHSGGLEYRIRYRNARGGRFRVLHQKLILRYRAANPAGAGRDHVRWFPLINDDDWENAPAGADQSPGTLDGKTDD